MASASDTEVLPHLYEEFGDDFLHRLRGMFAIALWDAASRRLVLARDRLGKKPLYYLRHRESLRFASEIKAMFADRSVPREVDYQALHHYLCLQYVPAPWTAFAGIRALEPGQRLIVTESGERVEQWWALERPAPRSIDRREAGELVRHGLREAVRLRMISDVPVGAFLSGGIDSACVVATMAELADRPVRTFTIGFPEDDYDERVLARETAQRFATDHTEIVVEPDVAGLLPLLAWHYDQPFADHSSIPTYVVARETRRHVTVALNGDGGDEAFAGYERIQQLSRLRQGRDRSIVSALVERVPVRVGPMRLVSRLGRGFTRATGSLPLNYARAAEIFPERVLRAMYTPEMADGVSTTSTSALLAGLLGHAGDERLWRVQLADYRSYLPGALLPKVDVATMAVSLEARSPFLDSDFVELAASLPSSLKLDADGAKVALRDAFSSTVPHNVLAGAKRGFGVPLDRWFREELAAMTRGLLLGEQAALGRFIRHECTDRLLEAHESGRENHGVRIFSLLCLELWLRTFVTSTPPLTPPVEMQLSDLS